MDVCKQECKLCENIILDENFKVIDEGLKNILDILLLKLTLDNDTQNVICTTCSSKLLAASNFKSTCLDMDKSIMPHIELKNPRLVDLKDIYAKGEGNKQRSIMLNDWEICRLCLKPMSSDHKSIQEVSVDSIQIFLPEIDFAVTTNPTICLKCHDELNVHSTFIRNCLDILTNPCLKIEVVQIKSEKMDEALFEDVYNLKKGAYEEGDASYDLDDLQQTSAQSTVAKKQESLTVGKYQCPTCTFNTRYRASFIKHELTHKDPLEVRVFECDECDYKTSRKGHLRQHQLKHKNPSELQMHTCDKCNFVTKYKNSLINHYLQHKNDSEAHIFKCDECDYKTIHKRYLKHHQLKHKDPSEVRMFRCDECDYENIQKGNLLKHQLTHKDPSEVRMFECGECDYKTIHKVHLNQHQLRHKDPAEVQMFECNDCDYKSVRKGDMEKHQLRHKNPSETQIHMCDVCDYKSNRKSHLKRHQLKHKKRSRVTKPNL